MTEDEIIEMATEAGLCCASNGFIDWIDAGPSLHEMTLFAKLIAEKEREACAKRAEIALLGTLKTTSERVLKAIRARGQA